MGIVKKALDKAADFLSSVVRSVVNLVSSIVNMIASPFMGLLGGMPDMPDSNAEAQRQQGVLLQRAGSIEPIPVIYGYRKVGGIVTFVETGSNNNQYLWVAYVMSEGCVEGLREIFIDDYQIDTKYVQQLNAGENIDITDGKYAGRVRMRWYPGVYFSPPSSSTVGENDLMSDAPSWKRSMCYNGMAVLFARFYWKKIETQADADSNPFSGGIPKVQAGILGRRVASLATGSGQENYTYGGTGYSESYSINPAEVILDYLRNPRYGKGLANTDIDWDAFRIARNKFAQTVTYAPGITGPILTTNYVLDTRQTLFQNIKMLLQGCRSYLPYVQGKYKLKVEDAGNPTDINSGAATIAATFTRDNIIGEINYTGIERSSKYNYVELTYVDPDQKFSNQNVAYPEDEATRLTYIDQDGGRENGLTVTFPTLTNRQMALDMARLLFNKSRYQESITFRATSQAFELEPGDCVRIQAGILNFGNVPWRIVNIKLNNDMSFDISCVRNPDWIYPYVTANTPDLVLPPYLPIGGGTILPSYGTGSGVGVGLVPPNQIVLPPGVTVPVNTSTNPPPSTVTTSSTNNSSTAPIIPPLVDVADFFSTRSVRSGDYVTFQLEYKQPTNAQYGDLCVWYKGIYDLYFKQFYLPTKPGPGETISFNIGPVLAVGHSKYQVVTRVRYLTGEYSTKITKIELDVPTSTSGITGIDNPADYFETVVPGWKLNLTPPPAGRDNVWGTIQGTSLRDNGQLGTILDPRGMYFILRQRLSATEPTNGDISGVEILYKEHTDIYWSVARYENFNVLPGGEFHVKMGGSADSANALGNIGDYRNYDFIFRVLYKDGTVSTNQVRISGANYVDVQGYTTSTQTMAELPANDQIRQAISDRGPSVIEALGDFTLTTIDQAAATGSLADPRDTQIGISYFGINTAKLITPDASVLPDWRGVKFSARKIAYGETTDFASETISSTSLGPFYNSTATTNISWSVPLQGNYDYQIVMTPIVRYGGANVEGRYSLVGRGYPQLDTTSTSLVSKLNFKQALTAEAFNKIQADPPPAPVVNEDVVIVQDWELVKQNAAVNSTGYLLSTNKSIPIYHYRLKFSMNHISNFKYVTIYRRSNNLAKQVRMGSGSGSVYTEILANPWESTTVSTTSTGTIIINLRTPITGEGLSWGSPEYNSSGEFIGLGTVAPMTNYSFPNSGIAVTYGSGYRGWNALPQTTDEFLLVVKSGTGAGTTSTKAIYLTGAPPQNVNVSVATSYLTTNVKKVDYPGKFNSYSTASSMLRADQSAVFTNNTKLVPSWGIPYTTTTGTVTYTVQFSGVTQYTSPWNSVV